MADPVNSFDHPRGEAHFDTYRPDDVAPALDAADALAQTLLARLPAEADPLQAFGDAFARFDFIVAVATELAAVLGGDWIAASASAGQRAASFHAAIYQRPDLRAAIAAAASGDPVASRLRSALLRRFELSGAGLDPPGAIESGASSPDCPISGRRSCRT